MVAAAEGTGIDDSGGDQCVERRRGDHGGDLLQSGTQYFCPIKFCPDYISFRPAFAKRLLPRHPRR
jgi:hypothetical protein